MSDQTKRPAIRVSTDILDPEDGESGIIEVVSGKVLARFPTLRDAKLALKADGLGYLARAKAAVGGWND